MGRELTEVNFKACKACLFPRGELEQKPNEFILNCLPNYRSSSVSQLWEEPSEISLLCKTLTSV